ncbi:methyltransferase domain-containing protein [Agromyces sp. PvR057]|uniref:methyltransferase domain-containing protein n=1 Tax=Agromyces sp. PvR057 TaxID=3156403 RepID=UPI001314F4A8
MLTARAALLDSSLYGPICETVADLATPAPRLPAESADATADGPRLVDFGCGTGYYAAQVAARVSASSVLLTDRSPIAVRMATRSIPGATGVVLDIWRPLPLRDASADLALNIFAPRNPVEYARVVRPGGVLVVVVPREGHLAELRRDGSVLTVPADKERLVAESLGAAGFAVAAREHVEYAASVTADQRAHLVAMGPSAHHSREATMDALSDDDSPSAHGSAQQVTVSVDVLTFRREIASASA